MFIKRLMAYIIDIIIILIITSIVGSFISNGSNIGNLNDELMSMGDKFLKGDIGARTYINQYAGHIYSMDRELFLSNLIGVVISILYFVVYPLYNDGASIGKKLIGLKVVSFDGGSVSANGLIFRYLLIDGIGVTILSLCGLFVVRDFNYFIFVSILNFLQFLVVIISIFMILYRTDKRSLPDLVAGTKVIEVK